MTVLNFAYTSKAAHSNMQDMRKLISFIFISLLLFSGMAYLNSYNTEFSGISEAQALPDGIEGINLDEIKSFISSDEPRIIFFYASWCPYCKKQMRGFKLLKDQYPTDKILAISTDEDPEKFRQYIKSYEGFPFKPYIYQGTGLVEYLKNQGSSFNGGIPYFAGFKKGEFKQEFIGLTHPKELAEFTEK